MIDRFLIRPLLAAASVVGFALPTLAADPAALEQFEKHVRPILVEKCQSCHGAKKQRGGLRLDSPAALRKGGDSGPPVLPGRPEASLLIKAIHHGSDELRMPPDAKLPAEQITALEQWVRNGAVWPAESVAVLGDQDRLNQMAREHWAFQPIRGTATPHAIDAIVRARLARDALTPSPPADPRTLLRRLSYDLIGLPPTAEEVEAFARDPSPAAYAAAVDRLLASPHYGERWGRHWLDVARYADTKDGVLMYGHDRIRPFAYTYRDYVVRALNEDTPFDRFVHEQLAADLIQPPLEPWRLGALGFLTLGRMFDNNVHDVLDDRIDTVTRGLLGLTVSCARCHDHKYDPIPTADYYSLYGVFASCDVPPELPLIGRPQDTPGGTAFEAKAAAQRQALHRLLDTQFELQTETARQRVGDYLVAAATTPPDLAESAVYFLVLDPGDLRPPFIGRWRRFLERRATRDDPVFGPWHDLMRLPDADYAAAAKGVIEQWRRQPTGRINPIVRDALATAVIQTKVDVARTYGAAVRRVYEESKHVLPAQATDADARRQLLELVVGRDAPAYFPKAHTYHYMSRKEKDSFANQQTALDKLAATSTGVPPRAMVVADNPVPVEPCVFVRGNAAQPGPAVPRQFLRVLAGDRREPFRHGSGRLDLAHAVTAPDNPLTARVIANRVWMHLTGEPLVATPNDFGFRSSPPTHPELLDHLAASLADDGWSLKRLIRRVVTSDTYRQASLDRPDSRRVDPENRLLWRANRRRLDLEAMRDTMLSVSGQLDRALGGRPGDAAGDAANRRRTLYGLVDRQSLPGLYRAFDFASPDQSAERRPRTTVPQQALFGMNSPFVIAQARALAARPECTSTTDAAGRVAALYRRVFARPPSARELGMALTFLGSAQRDAAAEYSGVTAVEQLAQVLLLTNEFMFVD